ncbi:Heavy metal transport/detoxification protein [Methylobacterium sp. 4-46]|uniref:heavy-metal-associated domain-containing protein n=1 Tax=unclassified Methylobacterium TaxID=2615210 RepID=UPI000152E204|nr:MULTISPECIES: heavy-metal-associated domain-containing protein [Methylobacterium]ACA16267.1 Heavy metal transport/detoxification protein [Methylobacterium sp. 4-46]WFT81976.1 heavy-metal-associated domain-containing protein [Methylobacterium nodulans]
MAHQGQQPGGGERVELLMQVEGMTCGGCVEAVTRALRRLDPEAAVAVDLGQGRVSVTTDAQALDVAQALARAGYEARAMTG